MEAGDLTAWIGKPPPKSNVHDEAGEFHISTNVSENSPSPAASEASSDVNEVNHDASDEARGTEPAIVEQNDEYSDDPLQEEIPYVQANCFVDVPKLSERQKEKYDYMVGHFTVSRILSEFRGGGYLVRLESGEKDLVRHIGLFPCVVLCSGSLFFDLPEANTR